MSNTTDLIARLRDWSEGADTSYLCDEAADALTAQAREIEALTIERDLNVRQCDFYQSQFEALRAELARLKAALSWLDRWIGHKSLRECADKVRDALAGKKVTP
jgi:hypothetical protein